MPDAIDRMGWHGMGSVGSGPDQTRIRAPTYYYNFSNATRPGATQSNASKIFLIKTYQSTFHITFSKTQQQQSNDCTYYRRRNRRTHCAVYSVLWRSLAVAGSADWTPPRYGYLSRARFRFHDCQPHRRHLRRMDATRERAGRWHR